MGESVASPPKILLIHNGDDSAAHYVRYLTNAGLVVNETHAPDALAAALVQRPDLIVLDFEVDGETIAALKSHTTTRAIPIIALAEFVPSARQGGDGSGT